MKKEDSEYIHALIQNSKKQRDKEEQEKIAFRKYTDDYIDKFGFTLDDVKIARDAEEPELADYIQGLFDSSFSIDGKMPEKVAPVSFLDNVRIDINVVEELLGKKIDCIGETKTAEPESLTKADHENTNQVEIRKILNREGFVDGDLSTVARKSSIDKIAEYIIENNLVKNLTPEMLSWARQKNGSPYTIGTLEEAIKRGKPLHEPKKK